MGKKEVSTELKLSDLAIQLPTFGIPNGLFDSEHWKTVMVPYLEKRLEQFYQIENDFNDIKIQNENRFKRKQIDIPKDFEEFQLWFIDIRYPNFDEMHPLPKVKESDFTLFDNYKEKKLYEYYLTDFYNLFSIDGSYSDTNTNFDQVFLTEWQKNEIPDKAFFRNWLIRKGNSLKEGLETYFDERIKEQFLLFEFIKWLTNLTAETMPKEENGELFDIDLIKRINELNGREKIFEPLGNEQLSKALNDPGNYADHIKVKERKQGKFFGLIDRLENHISDSLNTDDLKEWLSKILDATGRDSILYGKTKKQDKNRISLNL